MWFRKDQKPEALVLKGDLSPVPAFDLTKHHSLCPGTYSQSKTTLPLLFPDHKTPTPGTARLDFLNGNGTRKQFEFPTPILPLVDLKALKPKRRWWDLLPHLSLIRPILDELTVRPKAKPKTKKRSQTASSPKTAAGSLILDEGYISPTWRFTLREFGPIATWALYPPLLAAWVAGVALAPFVTAGGEFFVGSAIGLHAMWFAAVRLRVFLEDFRGGYGLKPNGSDRLKGEFATGSFRLLIDGTWTEFDASSTHQFFMREHKKRVDEARNEQLGQMYRLGHQPDIYRRAFEIVLDIEGKQYVLAEPATEEQARHLVRRLQECAAHSTGAKGAGSNTRNPGETGARPIDMRPVLD